MLTSVFVIFLLSFLSRAPNALLRSESHQMCEQMDKSAMMTTRKDCADCIANEELIALLKIEIQYLSDRLEEADELAAMKKVCFTFIILYLMLN